MTGQLFEARDAYAADPTQPPKDAPTPVEVVATLTATERRARVESLIEQAWEIYGSAQASQSRSRTLVARCVLFSGGDDSTVLAHLFRREATHAIHANTGIGIEQTRQFVRETCRHWGLRLIEKHAPVPYRDLVLEHGFPGPAMHWKMYTRLKERALDLARQELGIAHSRTSYAIFLAGRRREESRRRKHIALHESDGTVVWVSPLANWTKLDLNTYRLMVGDVPVNQVSQLIHMSGECLCGAFARPGELDEIGAWFPEVAESIRALEAEARSAGHTEPACRWGHGKGVPSAKTGRLCSSCDALWSDEALAATARTETTTPSTTEPRKQQ